MIYYTLRGGLGNMMFGIATTHSLSLSHKTKAVFTNLKTQLDYLNRETNFNPKLKHSNEYMGLNFIGNMIFGVPPKNIKVYTYPFHYEEKVITEDDFHIDGFFQSEKYFKKHEDEIRELFKPTEDIIDVIKNRYSDLLKHKTTSIHIRRGDYVRNQNNHPTQPLQYYQKAIELTKDDTEKYIIFSDDIEWCKDVFIGDRFIYIDDEKDYIELYMMSLCKNNIISNSSFSWWGAWLNDNIDKKVVSPKKWFGPNIKHNTNDIIPESWIKI